MKILVMIAPLFLLSAFSCVLLSQQTTPGSLVFKRQRVAVTEAPAGTAKVCLTPSGYCFTPPTEKDAIPFGLSPEAEVIQVGPDQEALLFTAVASASGSGSRKLIALLDIRNGRLENLLTDVTISNQGEYKIWQEPGVSKTALLVTADFVWGASETHFSAHRFIIRTYVLDSVDHTTEREHYFLQDEYMTSSKYPSLDEVSTIAVLDKERREVLARLSRQK